MTALTFYVLPEALAVCQLEPGAPFPDVAHAPGSFVSMTRTGDELSIVCPEAHAPAEARLDGGWRALRMEGAFDLSLVGILAPVAGLLAQAGVNIFVISTFNTDYVLVKESRLPEAIAALEAGGHTVRA